ncbi:hypothetical protein HW090_11675 [Pseudomonas sp. ABC1]|uniref:hypothetical protein n=1 Tax=Pseudomonas sp. ABC1 TaxID=2748080 RepID=UPI0015C30682|nr:hypothetical protein [Pseudomonas sp. ABC1]QLF93821.1 hypothetical protein HW090_11675 [Pseudomonas sp. ABC1]
MSTLRNYEYGYSDFTLTLSQRNELARMLVGVKEKYSLSSSEPGLAQPLYDKLLSFMPEPEAGEESEYLKVYTWMVGARDVNQGEGVFATYIHNYTANQYFLRFGERIGEGLVNGASNAIGITLVERILQNAGRLPSIEGIGAVDGGESVRMVFQHPEYYPEGDYTGWAGTLLFPFLGYKRFFNEWLLDKEQVEATINVGSGPGLPRITKQYEGSYDLFATLKANLQTVEQLNPAEQFASWWRSLSALDKDHDDLVQATNDYVSRIYALEPGHAFEAGGLLPFVGAVAYLSRELDVKVGTLGDDVIDDYWPDAKESFIIHAGNGDDIIYIPPYAESSGAALIDGGSGYDRLFFSNSDTPHALFISLDRLDDAEALYTWRFSVNHLGSSPASKEKAFVYSVEYLEASSESDWLSVSRPVRSNVDIMVDLAGQGDYGNTLDFLGYQTGVSLNVSNNGWIALQLEKEQEEGESAVLYVGGARNIIGSQFNDYLSYGDFEAGLHITMANSESGEPSSWHYVINWVDSVTNSEDQAFIYSMEALSGTSLSDWLKISYPLQLETDVMIDLVAGGAYSNTLDLSDYQSGINLGLGADGWLRMDQAQSGTLYINGVDNIIGSALDDVLVGNDRDNILDGRSGNNTLWGGDGADTFVVGVGSNIIGDADETDRLVMRIPVGDSEKLIVLGGGVLLRAQVQGVTGQSVPLLEGQAAYFHPVQPNPMNYMPSLSGVWPVLDSSLGREFIIRYSLSDSDLNISARFLDEDWNTSIADVVVRDYQDGDLGLSFSELIVPNYTNASAYQKPMSTIIDEFEQAHFDLLQEWVPPPALADTWYVA